MSGHDARKKTSGEPRSLRLPILVLPLEEQRYSCHGCGNCCRDFTVHLREDDLRRLREQRWEERLGEPVVVAFRDSVYLRQREDGSCIFWMPDGRCRIHAEFGFEEKPIACQFFPFSVVPGERDAAMGVSFACGSVLENKGASLPSHKKELLRMVERAPETVALPVPVALSTTVVEPVAEERELAAITNALDAWMRNDDLVLSDRLAGFAWIAESFLRAKLAAVRGERFVELVATLVGGAGAELEHLDHAPATARQRSMLRQAVFARTEDPKIALLARSGRWRTAIGQFLRSRRFAKAKGLVPKIGDGWPDAIGFAAVERVRPIDASTDIDAIDELLTRYVRATIFGRRAWGAGYYGWPVALGLCAVALNIACVGWLARLHAAGRGHDVVDILDVRAALSRIDRTSGRAPWLGGAGERLRIEWLAGDDGLRRLIGLQFDEEPA
jgi:lysine-N-methylase